AELTHCAYADHYDYTDQDIVAITHSAQQSKTDSLIITTEKDMSKLVEAGISTTDIPVYVLPITISFSENDERILMHTIAESISKKPV
ncbi:MAG: tetraacyldisaccharide 4'-kinase, partial [Bacteroidota bacterium]